MRSRFHSIPSIAHFKEVEGQHGIGMDFGGLGIDQRDRSWDAIVAAVPRLSLKDEMKRCMCRLAHEHPHSTYGTFVEEFGCAADSPGFLLSIEAKVACSVATTCAPSPTAAATRLIEPERTSPIAKIPRRLVSSGLRVSLQSPPVSTKPLVSNATPDPDNQSVFGSAPMNKKRC